MNGIRVRWKRNDTRFGNYNFTNVINYDLLFCGQMQMCGEKFGVLLIHSVHHFINTNLCRMSAHAEHSVNNKLQSIHFTLLTVVLVEWCSAVCVMGAHERVIGHH